MVVSLLDEVQGAEFGDKRLDRRLGTIIEELGANPNLSVPAATDTRAVEWKNVSLNRCRGCRIALPCIRSLPGG